MIKVKVVMADGRSGILIGLSRRNVEQLMGGAPIYFDAGATLDVTTPIGGISIFFGEDEAAMLRDLTDVIGPHTRVVRVPIQ